MNTLSNEQLDVAAFSYSYHFLYENNSVPAGIVPDSFWGDEDVRAILLRHRFEHHSISHTPSCFKKSCECRFLFPFRYNESTRLEPEELDPEVLIPWHRLSDPEVVWLSPWTLIPKRDIGCEYVNTYNLACSDVFNCNTNVQIGDVSQVYYSTLYGSKSTQKEDSERVQRILHAVVRRLLKIEEDIMLGRKGLLDANDDFTKSLCILLSGMRAATSRHVVSATLAHLIVSLNGTRFTFSHDFGHLLVSQLEATLEGSPVDVRVRTTKVDGETYFWPDSSSEDYIHRPNSLDGMCSYEMAMYYKKVVKSKSAVRASLNVSTDLRSKENDDGDDVLASDDEMFQSTSTGNTSEFLATHPGSQFTKLSKLKNWVVPMTYYDGARLCSIFNLCIGKQECDENTAALREEYAKLALLMFYPLRKLEDIQIDGSYWNLFERELFLFKRHENTTMWKKGFEILQNIENRRLLHRDTPKQPDHITKFTVNKLDTDSKPKKKNSTLQDDKVISDIQG